MKRVAYKIEPLEFQEDEEQKRHVMFPRALTQESQLSKINYP